MSKIRKIVLASTNKGKVREFQAILGNSGYEIVPVSEFDNVPEVEETESTFEGNAILKAVSIAKTLNLPTIADDSGLCVHGLGNRPGVFSARSYGAKQDGYKAAFEQLWQEMALQTPDDDTAHFECCIAVATPEGVVRVATGQVFGRITKPARGNNGFGYDPVFVPDGYSQTFAEIDPSVKNSISHRAKALEFVPEIIKEILF